MNDWLIYANSIGLVALVAALFQFVPAYFSEKGKNAAARRDLAALTKITEEIKGRVGHVSLIQKAHFEVEFQAIRELWSKAQVLRHAHVACTRPGSLPSADELRALLAAQTGFTGCLHDNAPFLPESVGSAFQELQGVLTAVIDPIESGQRDDESLAAGRGELFRRAQVCMRAIQERLRSLTIVE